jgi:hypothetical protein
MAQNLDNHKLKENYITGWSSGYMLTFHNPVSLILHNLTCPFWKDTVL